VPLLEKAGLKVLPDTPSRSASPVDTSWKILGEKRLFLSSWQETLD
jgi:hypothetical protein